MTLAFVPVDPIEDVLSRLAFYRRSHLSRGSPIGVRNDFEADLCDWFGLRCAQARIVATLYAAGAPVDRDALLRQARVNSGTLRQELAPIREALGEAALPRPADGFYTLTQLGRAACDEAVANVGIGYLRGRLAA